MKHPTLKIVYVLTGFVIWFYGCTKDVYEKPIDSEILVAVFEDGGRFQIMAETVKQYPCSNFRIAYSERKIGYNIWIRFKYIQENDGCLTAIRPAKSTIDLGPLDKKDYDITFKLNGETTLGKLYTETVRLEMNPSGNVKLK